MSTQLPDPAVERFVESRRALVAVRAKEARDAIASVLADPKIRTHGVSYSQFKALNDAKVGLEGVL